MSNDEVWEKITTKKMLNTSHQKETINISRAHNEKSGLGKIDTQRTY